MPPQQQVPPPQPQQQYSVPPPQPQSASQMISHKPVKLLIVIGLLTLLLISAVVFGIMMLSSRNDFRDNVNEKIDEAVLVAVEENTNELEASFKEREKEPLKTYKGPDQFGTLTIEYPKTWSAYVDQSGSSSTHVDGYLHPNYVPGVKSGTAFALRFEVVDKQYSEVLSSYESEVKKGSVKVSPITLEKVPSVAGTRVDGEVEKEKQGSVVLFPLRDKTIRVSVLSDQFIKDFDSIILKNMSFIK